MKKVYAYRLSGWCRAVSALVLLASCLALPIASQAEERQLYRYKNERGLPVINDRLPPEVVSRGYDIIRPDGQVIKRVPRQLTEQEIRDQSSEEARARMREEEELRMRAWDESLMLRYSSIEDIEAARKRAERDLLVRISILKSNLSSVKSQIESEQAKAADLERRGADVPASLAKVIEALRREIEDTEESIEFRRQEVKDVNASYERDKNRFNTLVDRVQLRNRASTGY